MSFTWPLWRACETFICAGLPPEEEFKVAANPTQRTISTVTLVALGVALVSAWVEIAQMGAQPWIWSLALKLQAPYFPQHVLHHLLRRLGCIDHDKG